MKKLLMAVWLGLYAIAGQAVDLQKQDIDIFLSNPTVVTSSDAPNVLIVLDNTANWNTPFSAEKTALTSLFSTLTSATFNIGLMMFSETGKDSVTGEQNGTIDGGYMRYAVRPLQLTSDLNCATKTDADLKETVQCLDVGYDKSNGGKLGQTMREAYLYFKGATAYSGIKAKRDYNAFTPSTSSSTTYRSPVTGVCQKNFIIFINNGPVQDNTADTKSATDALTAVGGNTTTIPLSPSGSQDNIGDEWSRFMSATDLSNSIAGQQNVITYTIEVQPSTTGQGPGMTALLKSMAQISGGRYISITNPLSSDELKNALKGVFDEILAVNSVFTSAAVTNSVNNYGTTLDQVYVGMFRADANAKPRWNGNLKHYRLGLSGNQYTYLDKNGQVVVNSLGQVTDTVTSYWTTASSFWTTALYTNEQTPGGQSDAPDGSLTIKGGAAEHLRAGNLTADNRTVYTCISCSSSTVALLDDTTTTTDPTLFNTNNASITTTKLGVSTDADRTALINWTRGRNTKSDDPSTGATSGVRGYVHGDVVHSSPLAINYNRSSQPANRDIVVYYGSNDGFLHAVKGGANDADGGEQWSFVAEEFFPGLKRLYDNTVLLSSSNTKPYFFDGPIGSYLLDADNDRRYDNTGKTDATKMDKVYIYPTARRGGRLIYALDVTNPSQPKFLWKHTNADTGFYELGQTWSRPKAVKIAGHSNPVLIFGGGYDAAANDDYPRTTATMGRAIFVVDAFTGALVWKAVPDSTSSDCDAATCSKVSGLDFSIPAGVATVDRDLNGVVDRLYANDTGGNVWRVDLGLNPSTGLPTFSVNKIAALGGSGVDQRKFLYEPDVVLGAEVDRVQVGSGDREKPFNIAVQDMFFSIKDPGLVSNVITTPYTVSDLYDATADLVQLGTAAEQSAARTSLASTDGWYIRLNGNLTSRDLSCDLRSGERVTGKAITLNGILYFATFMPDYVYTYSGSTGCTATAAYSETTCTPTLGVARVYLLNFADGSAYSDATDAQTGWALTDRYVTVGTGFLGDPTVASQTDSDGNIVDTPLFGLIADPGGLTGALGHKARSKVYWYEITD
ncbi:pilus assembly protein [Vogesella oryzae]|uniref:pilus assembly protein n=1 Tax=Vogesella oryzae TaxID=1735285 RepID=UPI0015839ED5|nr:PilC/PilY family type IV pilus protein [Vogesella oryzae]